MAKYCAHCGKIINDDAVFCMYCGEKVDTNIADINNSYKVVRKEQVVDIPDTSGGGKMPKGLRIIAGIVIAFVFISTVIGAIIYYYNQKNPPEPPAPPEDKEVTDVTDETEGEDSVGTSIQNLENETEPYNKYESKYHVGETYTVQTNLRVREGPGKNYRILNRSELTSEDYAISVDSKTTTDALLEKGKRVVCLEMHDNWMRISSGWVCVEDEGEVLIDY